MDILIIFHIFTSENIELSICAEATLSGKRIEATFHHDIEDDRECMVDKITSFNEDGDELTVSETLKEIVYEHVNKKDMPFFQNG